MEATVLPRARCNPAWFTSLMLKKRVAALDGEVRADYVTAAKQSVLDYILLEVRIMEVVVVVTVTVMMTFCQEEERTRLDISVRPRPWEPRVVRAPVPWHQSFLQVRGGGDGGGDGYGGANGANGGEGYGGDIGTAGQPVLQTQPLLPQHSHGQAQRPLVAQVRQGATASIRA